MARIYNFNVVTYGDLSEVMTALRGRNGVFAWGIEHTPDDDDKVKHIHVVVKCAQAHSCEAVKKWLKHDVDGVEQNVRVEACKSLRGSIRYLMHLDDPDKPIYTPDGVVIVGGERAQEIFADSVSDEEPSDRQYDVIMAYALYEISLREAMKRAPEIFIHKYVSMQKLVQDLRREINEETCKAVNEMEVEICL